MADIKICGSDGKDLDEIISPNSFGRPSKKEVTKYVREVVGFRKELRPTFSIGRFPWQAYIVAANLIEHACEKEERLVMALDDVLGGICTHFLLDYENLPSNTEIVQIGRPFNSRTQEALQTAETLAKIPVHRVKRDPELYTFIRTGNAYLLVLPHLPFEREITQMSPEIRVRYSFNESNFADLIRKYYDGLKSRAEPRAMAS